MAPSKTKLPSVLLLILSALGILFGGLIGGVTIASVFFLPSNSLSPDEMISMVSTSLLAFSVCILNIPTFLTSIKKLKQKPITHPLPSLFRKANYLLFAWVLILLIGYFVSKNETISTILPPFTITAIVIPIWWLVEFARRGLPRSTKLREWGTLTIGTTIIPILIITIEMIIVLFVIIAVMIALGLQTDFSSQISSFIENLALYQGGIEELERILYDLMKNPIVSAGIFLTLGLFAPFVEEIFKPMAIWFLLKRPLKESEGYSIGLISGGAFAFLESAGMVIQMQSQDWLAAIALRTAADVLHIGLSGLVGYGMVRSWNQKKYLKMAGYIISAALLHGGWNSFTLLTGYSSTLAVGEALFGLSNIANILAFVLLIGIFIGIIVINLKINISIRRDQKNDAEISAIQTPGITK